MYSFFEARPIEKTFISVDLRQATAAESVVILERFWSSTFFKIILDSDSSQGRHPLKAKVEADSLVINLQFFQMLSTSQNIGLHFSNRTRSSRSSWTLFGDSDPTTPGFASSRASAAPKGSRFRGAASFLQKLLPYRAQIISFIFS